jgi:hypothetical protein
LGRLRRLLLGLLLRLSLLRLLLLRLLGLRQGQHRYAGAERKAYCRKPDGPPHARETSCEWHVVILPGPRVKAQSGRAAALEMKLAALLARCICSECGEDMTQRAPLAPHDLAFQRRNPLWRC